jgi:GNAT superfamily N-acetyltransferase
MTPPPLDMSDPETDLSAIEHAAVRSWPALNTITIDGWIARHSSGGSTRGNSAAALAWSGTNLATSLSQVETFYRQHDAPPRFTITDAAAPASLDAALHDRGWERGADHVTQAKDIIAPSASHDAPSRHPMTIDLADAPSDAWLSIYLSGLSDDRRPVAQRLVSGIPPPLRFITAIRDGEAIASGLTVLDGPLASVQCMATSLAARRAGAATAVLAAIEAEARVHGVRRLYLQADGANAAGLMLYRRSGFFEIGRYHTRTLPL